MVKSDLDRLEEMLFHCKRALRTLERIHRDKQTFLDDYDMYNSISMSIFQIGEAANHLSADFKQQTESELPWQDIVGMRNWIGHGYGDVKDEILWDTVNGDISPVEAFCEKWIPLLEKDR